MTFKKILLKDAAGNPLGALTLGGVPACATLPENARAEACLADDFLFFPEERVFPLPAGAKHLSVLGKTANTPFFATTLEKEERAKAKWRLSRALEEKASKKPLPPPVEPMEPPTIEEEPLGERQSETSLTRAEGLLAQGTPFSLFEKLMPHSRWALVEEEGAAFLVGLEEENGKKRVMYGVPGVRDLPPDEEVPWAFFPTENEETGYFVTDAEKLTET